MISIDVVIPSYRLQAPYLLAMLNMDEPAHLSVQYTIVADNPDAEVPEELEKIIDGEKYILVRNRENLGASESRNRGIDQGNGDWILFLDDDVKPDKNLLYAYLRAIKKSPREPGFFGVTQFPGPINNYTRGLIVGDILYFFDFARYFPESKSVTTSNLMVNRKAMGDIGFRNNFPKAGGGEDFAFSLDLFNKTGKTLKAVKDAVVHHNWWKGGRRNYRQLFRWCYADREIFRLFRECTYIDFPNFVEMIFLGIIIGTIGLVAGLPWFLLPCILLGVIAGELFGEILRLLRLKGLFAVPYVHEVILLRGAADFGRLCGNITNLNFGNFLRRANYSNYKVNYHFRMWSGLKFFLALIFILFFMLVSFWIQQPFS